MSPSHIKATIRMVVGSFAAGAGAMVLVGLVGPVALQSGLSVRDAFGASLEQEAPLIEPLDVAAIQAQLADADRTMVAMRETTADNVARLDALANR
ncbi:MAG: hypothetical protein R3C25_12755 [Hyphomonadaceae bacterium]